MSKLTLLHINIIGAVLVIIVGVALYFTVISNANQQIATNQAAYNGVHDRASKLQGNLTALKKANQEKAQTEADYAIYQASYMPILGYSKRPPVEEMMRIWWP